VYIYKPAKAAEASEERSSKRRKVSKEKKNVQENEWLPFVSLLNGKEPYSLVQLRHSTFQQLWSRQEEEIEVSKTW
jgi:hypothetical protein